MKRKFLKFSPLILLFASGSYVAMGQKAESPAPEAAAVAVEEAVPAAATEKAQDAAPVQEPATAPVQEPATAPSQEPSGAPADGEKIPVAVDGSGSLLPDPNDPNMAVEPIPPVDNSVQSLTPGSDPMVWPFTRTKNADESQAAVPLAGISLFADRRTKATEPALQWEKEQKDSLKTGVQVTDGLMTPDPDGLRSALGKFIGKVATFKDLQDVVEIIEEHYRKHNRPMTHVYIPKQSLFSDRVVISIVEGRVGEVMILTEADLQRKPEKDLTVAEKSFMARMKEEKTWWNSWYNNPYKAKDVSAEFLPRTAKLKGRIVDTEEIKAQIAGMNRSPWVRLNRPVSHPFRDVTVNFAQPDDNVLGQTNLIFEVDDKRPLKFFAGMDNSLTETTGENRVFLGAAWYDAFLLGKNHQFGAQLFSALDPSELTGFSLNYQIPWQDPKLDQFTELFASYADSSVDTTIGGIPTTSTGSSIIFGGRHYIELPELFGATDDTEPLLGAKKTLTWTSPSREAAGLHHEVGMGFEFKSSDNNLLFGGDTVTDSPADVFNIVAEYNARQTDPTGETNLVSQLYWSPGNVTSDNTDEAFGPLRSDAEASYLYARIRLDRDQDLPFSGAFYGMMVHASVTGQCASTNLLASEQLGLGGNGSVRGYPERALRGDMGVILNLELFSPAYHPASRYFKWSWLNEDTLKFLAFFDYAHGSSSKNNVTDPLDDPADLMSVGAGLRYELDDLLQVRLDYGFRLKDLPDASNNTDDGAVHFGLTYLF